LAAEKWYHRNIFVIWGLAEMAAQKRKGEEHVNGATKAARVEDDVKSLFSEGVFDEEAKQALKTSIATSGPYKHGVIKPVINDSLLRKVREEILKELQFTRKETDIYKVNQTGDLANLSGLGQEELTRLSSLAKLREALYSKEFRRYLSYVASSGPLSGVKHDLSINIYDKGCHLLNHDDVIGSRRISYILYLTDPDEQWKPKWGGALRLYPTVIPNIPEPDWTVSIPPAWNQLSFFTVQPGLSFHDVEEVFFNKPRLSISGWFHIPQPGEDGFVEGEQEATEARSSLKQLESAELREHDFPKRAFDPYDEYDLSDKDGLTEKDVKYLSKYLNPLLLETDAMARLNDVFCDDSMIEIRDFLNPEYGALVKKHIDVDDLSNQMPRKSSEVNAPWKVAKPPHKFRYLYLDSDEPAEEREDLEAHKSLLELRHVFKHSAFRKWLKAVSSFTPTGSYVLGRRFRPGHDFTLATSYEADKPVLQASLCLTPSKGWDDGDVGGYDLCMAVDDDDANDDPAVYKSAGGGEEPVLFTNQACWNVFHLIVRDQGLLRFVKYVSKSAPGSRWDIEAEWTIDEEDDES
jgi:Rps23 Pro-64 3,4-dihydroxylase Tpa1-like proline 4-hydroxylase